MAKRLFFLTALVLMSLPALSQNLVSSFLKDIDENIKTGAKWISIHGNLLISSTGSSFKDYSDMKEIMERVDEINILSGLYANDKSKQQLKKALIPYTEFISVEKGGDITRMYIKGTKEQVEEFILYHTSDNKITLMSIIGKVDLEYIASLSERIKVMGMEHIKFEGSDSILIKEFKKE